MPSDEGLDGDRGVRTPLRVTSPKKPSPEEVAAHELTHLPFRSWCSHCVRGRGRVADHRKQDGERGVDELHVDYCFMGSADSETRTILVAKHIQTKALMGSVVPIKGASHEFPAMRIKAFCKELGLEYSDLVVKGDQEASIQDLVREITRVRAPAKTIPEQSPVGSSQSNGHVERGIQGIGGQVRVLKDALEARLGCKVPVDHDILAWLVEYAAVLLNRYNVSHDGLTAYERLKGKKSKLMGLEFGEQLHYRRQKIGNRLAKLDVMWEDGVFLGYRSTSGETIVGTASGVMRTRTVRRKPEDERWSAKNLDMVIGVPWKPDGKSQDRDPEDRMPNVLIEPALADVPIERPVVSEPTPRRLYVRTKDVEKHGPSEGCPGCRALLRGGKTQTHSETCRKRIAKALEDGGEAEVRLKAQRRREDEFFEKALRRADEARGQKRRGEEADDSERAARREESGRGVKRDAEQDVELEKRSRPDASSSASSAPASGSSSATPAQGEVTQDASQGETDDAMIQEVKEMRIEMEKFEDMYVTSACRSPEEDLDEGWTGDIEGAIDADQYIGEFLDDKTGKPLNAKKVKEAREEEIRALESRVYEVVDVSECWEKTGRAPIGVRWVDIDKGFGVYRSRLVAQDFKPKSKVNDKEGLFAAMPPLEVVKLLIAQAAVESTSRRTKIMFIDIGKAHLYGKMEKEAFVELPPERQEHGKCARLIYTLYGMREAATNWEREYSKTMRDLGFVQGKASSVTFYHPLKRMRVVVHGDDFIISGDEGDLWWLHDELVTKYLVKMRGILGPDRGDSKEVVVLNRVLAWRDGVFKYEADPRHVEIMLRDMGLEECKLVATPGVKGDEQDVTQLEAGRHRLYRSVVARANFLAQDRPDIRFSVKELCRKMSCPRECDWLALKRLCRYLRGRPRVVQYIVVGGVDSGAINVFVEKDTPEELDVVVDSDWAGCRETRRSTSGGCIVFRGVCLKFWSTTQQHHALSSGEAEYYAAVKGGSEGLYVKNLCSDLGICVEVIIHSDSAACRGMCNRDGVGKLRHVELQYFWLQQAVRAKKLGMKRILGAKNPADLMTKFLGAADIEAKMEAMGMFFEEGRTKAVDGV